ncbi:hypothetical protein SAMN05428988_3208 [Chitinophaga sp. YR573]|uniref:portal protein n=1 Tax=Chitinophaga sp. YR573 TaxID=1881040 RepID=UPI0008CE1C44|nr:hypothetical protein [Chitinophaga sp. YR573]SEW21419.1 hypothetical protein SAMN05428988_3208 [Chitinophaga sp. YR573]
MPIILHTQSGNLLHEYLATFPDQYVSQKEKESDGFIKQNMDYFANIAYAQYNGKKKKISRNYDLVKGHLKKEDFYEQPGPRSFIETLETEEFELPAHVRHYPILNPPLNTLTGELTKRPDTTRVKAYDADSKNEELAFRSDMLQQYILQNARNKIITDLAEQGQDVGEIDDQQIQELTEEKVEDELTSYTTLAERWGNHTLEALKAEFNIKEKSEEAFRDLLICSNEYYHIYETGANSLGFSVETANPKKVWELSVGDKKYSRDWYAGGLLDVMELSEIIERFPNVTKEEIDHLRKASDNGLFSARQSNYGSSIKGLESIHYDTYNPALLEERLLAESGLQDDLVFGHFFSGKGTSTSSYGNKFAVVIAYWKSKIKVGKVSYLDPETGSLQTTLVDENYKKGTIQGEISVEWRYANRWYQGLKIGSDVYHVTPFTLLPYCPIIGVTHESKNTIASSLIDLMKGYQMIYNVCLNQLWKLLEKEKGKVILIPLRHIPTPKDGDAGDALDMWELEARERGAIFIDDSPENAKAISSFNQYSALDLSRHQEIQSRYNLAVQMKMECWELVGLSKERLGNVAATSTATGVNTSLSQSYAQTEAYFTQHEYCLNELYQGLLDAAQYIESTKPTSTISYINSSGENAFIQVNGTDISLRDLKVFVTSRTKDSIAFEQLQQLAQPALQNGASLYDIAELYTTDSMRKLKDTFKRIKKRQDDFAAQQQQMQQQQINQAQQQFQATQQAEDMARKEQMVNENYQRELDRVNKKEIALIATFNRQQNNLKDVDANGTPDVLEVSRLAMEETNAGRDYKMALDKLGIEKQKLAADRSTQLEQLGLEKAKLKVKREEIASKERIAKANKNKYDKVGKK